jgi:hypothetical protein
LAGTTRVVRVAEHAVSSHQPEISLRGAEGYARWHDDTVVGPFAGLIGRSRPIS